MQEKIRPWGYSNFKVTLLTIFKELKGKIIKLQRKLEIVMKGSNGDLGNKKYYSENKNSISKFNSRLDTAEKTSE